MTRKTFLLALILVSVFAAYAQPSGSIIAFAGPQSRVPAGWVVCDGKLYDKNNHAYTALFNAIGVSWGGDGVNKFAVPDLQGEFLRGVANGSGTDPDKDARDKSRPDLNSSGNGGNAVGSKQPFAVGNHLHPIDDHGHTHISFSGTGFADGGNQRYSRNDAGFEVGTKTSSSTSNISVLGNGGSETRPINAYVYYIIKL